MEDLEIDDILFKRKKKLNSGDKGKRNERLLCKLLMERFGENFSRSVGSGNVWGIAPNMPKHAVEVYSGDIVCPESFKWVFEMKAGYNDIDLCSAMEGGNATLDAFFEQSADEAARCRRKPILIWKKDRKPWLAFVLTADMPVDWKSNYSIQYKEWTGVAFKELLKQGDGYWLNTTQ